MKMNTFVFAPRAGGSPEVKASVGTAVQEGESLVRISKSEARNPKSESNPTFEIRIPRRGSISRITITRRRIGLRASDFGIDSDFGHSISEFPRRETRWKCILRNQTTPRRTWRGPRTTARSAVGRWTLLEYGEVTSTNLARRHTARLARRSRPSPDGRARPLPAVVGFGCGRALVVGGRSRRRATAAQLLPLAAGLAVCEAMRKLGHWPSAVALAQRRDGWLAQIGRPARRPVRSRPWPWSGSGSIATIGPSSSEPSLTGYVTRLADWLTPVPAMPGRARAGSSSTRGCGRQTLQQPDTLLPRINALWQTAAPVELDLDGMRVRADFEGIDVHGRLRLHSAERRDQAFRAARSAALPRDLLLIMKALTKLTAEEAAQIHQKRRNRRRQRLYPCRSPQSRAPAVAALPRPSMPQGRPLRSISSPARPLAGLWTAHWPAPRRSAFAPRTSQTPICARASMRVRRASSTCTSPACRRMCATDFLGRCTRPLSRPAKSPSMARSC